ncbi:putative MOXD1-like 1 [Penaeus vannamei]|uniref:Putative MOXD1-like 1 n=1 Tax=Penaeus vannamei TaxID=6689 RepID=A0A3R7QT80_PENVA|nr:putative MOXD1-like 1 [Penaeus vannamei]
MEQGNISLLYAVDELISFSSDPVPPFGAGEMFPEHAGFPLGEQHGGATYLMMEIHYDNPTLKKGKRGDRDWPSLAGIRSVFHTEQTREHDAGILVLGHMVSHLEVIPPGMNWLTVGHCSADCLADRLPAEGVRVFQGVLHAHLLGREIHLRHLRDGQELPPVFADNNYDFNYQQARVLQDEMPILPGDSFITECRYDSRKISRPTFGGFGTEEEMCLAFLSYYPRVNVSSCLSTPSLETLLATVGVQDIRNRDAVLNNPTSEWEMKGTSELPEEVDNALHEELTEGEGRTLTPVEFAQLYRRVVATSPEKYANVSLYDILNDEATWEDFEMVTRLQDEVVYSNHVLVCGELDGRDREKMSEGYPDFVPYRAEDTTCGSKNQGPPTKGRPFQPHGNKINLWKMLCPSDLRICKTPRRPLGVLGNRPIFF